MKHLLLIVAAIVFVFGYALIHPYEDSSSHAVSTPDKSTIPSTERKNAAQFENQTQASSLSPFSTAAIPKFDQAAIIKARIERMKKLQYNMPDEYNNLGIKKLDELALEGDKMAAIQLGERYWSEKESAEWDPNFISSIPNKAVAQHYFEMAIREGDHHAANAMSAKLAEDGDVVNAEAWRLVGEMLTEGKNNQNTIKLGIRSLSLQEQSSASAIASQTYMRLKDI